MHLIGILLAAGAGVRFGGGKLLAKLPDTADVAVGARSCENILAVVHDVIAVVRPGDMALEKCFVDAGAQVSVCAAASSGMGSSLAHGVRVAAAAGADAVLIALGDMPWIRRDTITIVAAALAAADQIVVPRYGGKPGHPVGFGRSHFPALSHLRDDQGARDVIASAGAVRWIDVDDPGILIDIDTPEQLVAASLAITSSRR